MWGLENMLEQTRKQKQDAVRRKKRKAPKRGSNGRVTCGEEDALAMEYLGQHHDDNVEAANFMVMANLSGGEGKLSNESTRVLLFYDDIYSFRFIHEQP